MISYNQVTSVTEIFNPCACVNAFHLDELGRYYIVIFGRFLLGLKEFQSHSIIIYCSLEKSSPTTYGPSVLKIPSTMVHFSLLHLTNLTRSFTMGAGFIPTSSILVQTSTIRYGHISQCFLLKKPWKFYFTKISNNIFDHPNDIL